MHDDRQLALLRKHEPVLRFNRGERFFPMDAATFVENASLWVRARTGGSRCLRPQGSLTLESLTDLPPAEPGVTLFIRNAVPMGARELARHALEERMAKAKDPRDTFRAGRGRLARVGYASRLADALFSLSLLARGRVPGDLAAAAAVAYRRDIRRSEVYRYYGRVLECGDWMVLQYWYFYFFNDWRTGFFGTNDHEGDWESVNVFLGPDGNGSWQPEWITCSCHDYPGTELRRSWDDPKLETRGEHPVVYVGAGSHAGYYQSGDYLAEIELPVLAPVSQLVSRVQRVWRERLHQYSPHREASPSGDAPGSVLSVPFVDYARGDGHVIGPGEERVWSDPVLISKPPAWVQDYRGLWGYFANDPFAGEDAPPGPMYERGGAVRLSWQDPVTWCGLDSTPPRARVPEIVERMRSAIGARCEDRLASISRMRRELLHLGVRARVRGEIGGDEERARLLRRRKKRLQNRLVHELKAQSEDTETLQRLDSKRLLRGTDREMRLHLRRAPQPMSHEQLRVGRVAEVWAALSVGALLLALVGLAIFAREQLVKGATVLLFWVIVIEAFLRNRLTQLVSVVTVTLALVCAVVLVIEFHRPLAIGLAVGAGLFLLWENVRELWT